MVSRKELKGLPKEVYKDYSGLTFDRTFKINFKKKISKSIVYVSKKTGLKVNVFNILIKPRYLFKS